MTGLNLPSAPLRRYLSKSMIRLHFRRSGAGALGLVALLATAAAAQDEPVRRTGLYTEPLAGQTVAVLPLTHVVRDTAVPVPAEERQEMLRWADGIVIDGLLLGAPEVNWTSPEELRRMARRNPGFIPDPDRMGQAMMRNPSLKRVPDPLRASLRNLVSIAGGRLAFIPAALTLTRDEEGAVRATLSVVLADSRLGTVAWRAEAIGAGPDAESAVKAAVQSFLPHDPTAP